MGWRQPTIWVETTENPTVLAGPTDLDPFALTQSKSFLLGHAKYGPKASWDPVAPLRAALRPRRFRAGDWPAFLDSLDDLGDREGVDDDGLRVVSWSET